MIEDKEYEEIKKALYHTSKNTGVGSLSSKKAKLQHLEDVFLVHLNHITENEHDWARFLECAARMYKYPFQQQILIHAQRPEAIACADFGLWTEYFKRRIISGSKGIALSSVDGITGQRKISYVFDIADTEEGTKNSVKPDIWSYHSEDNNEEIVLQKMSEAYGAHFTDIGVAIKEAVKQTDAFEEYAAQESSALGIFQESTEYVIKSRLDIATGDLYDFKKTCDYLQHLDFDDALVLGENISCFSEIILRKIEKIIKNHGLEKSNKKERGNEDGSELTVQGRERRSSAGRGVDTRRGERRQATDTQARASEIDVYHGAPARILPEASTRRNAAETPERRTRRSEFKDSSDQGTDVEERSGAQQRDEPDGMGAAREHDPGTGRRDRPEGIDLHVEFSPGDNKAQSNNYQLSADFGLAGGAKTRYKQNVEAITTLKQIEFENRQAMPSEKDVMSRYVGWGGLSQVFDPNNTYWHKEYVELRNLLTGDEYEAARTSTLNAHYTSPIVINAMYAVLSKMGFSKGKLLEPAMGVGNFWGLLPEEMQQAELHGVEIDSITGRLAKQLYQKADIHVSAFEDVPFPDNSFDVAVGNVPFGNYKVADPKYDKYNFNIHDYFFAKSLDAVRPGGVVAFVTSKGTMDKNNPSVRRYICERAELLGAIRLPCDAFKHNAGTEVTTDILFLQKRKKPIALEEGWVHLDLTSDGIPVNHYFIKHPEMVLGTMVKGPSLYGGDSETTCLPFENRDLIELLQEAISHIHGEIKEYYTENKPENIDIIPAAPNIRNWSYTVINDDVYYRHDGIMKKVDIDNDNKEHKKDRLVEMIALTSCVRELLDLQLHDANDTEIADQQERLSVLYDDFVDKYGLINQRTNEKIFDEDSSYNLICALEELDADGKFLRKSDTFTKRTINPHVVPNHVDTAHEALLISLAEKGNIDLDYMSELTSLENEKLVQELRGEVFMNPEAEGDSPYETADEYLSGPVVHKLDVVKRLSASGVRGYERNIEYLEAVQPEKIEAQDIAVKLGATWVDPKYYADFIAETLDVSNSIRRNLRVLYSPHSGEYSIEGVYKDWHNVNATTIFGTPSKNAYELIELSLNLREATVYENRENEETGQMVRVRNTEKTILAQKKQETLKQAFTDWIFHDPDRRNDLVDKYNEMFNSTRNREYSGKHLAFPGKNPEIDLRKHQRNAVARILQGNNTLLAHEVGAGKTYAMVAAAMEAKRLGLCSKPLIVVPNHLTGQMASEIIRLYPLANVLVTGKEDFSKDNRLKFCARIATGDYDMVVMGHSQFEKVPMSVEYQKKFIKEQLDIVEDATKEAKRDRRESFQVKQMAKVRKSLEARMKKLVKAERKDNMLDFEQLGVDKLFVDEADVFKNLFFHTKMHNVAGIPQAESQRAQDMYLKCRYLDERTNNKGIVFATGTPVSNSMTEIYTMMRYLQYPLLEKRNMLHFDSWAATFGETTISSELAPDGSKIKSRTRFSKFYNLPELTDMFKQAADIQTADALDLPRPNAEYRNVSVKPSEEQKEVMRTLSKRADDVAGKLVQPNVDNMLKITHDGRYLALDQRLYEPSLPDNPESKLNACVDNVHRIWRDTEESRSTQLLFSDIGVPKKNAFNVYDDIKSKLIALGIPEKEIAFIHDAVSDKDKRTLFGKVRSGDVRILLGSTEKMGAGTNVQNKLIALHDLDCPWRPRDLEQRHGRILRQGNENPAIEIYRYVTEGTFDAYLYQTVENKQRFISQVMTSRSPMRSCEDVDETVLNYAEVKALCVGNPLIKEKMQLEVDISKLSVAKDSHQSSIYKLQDNLRVEYPKQIESLTNLIKTSESDFASYKEQRDKNDFKMVILGKEYDEKPQAGELIVAAAKSLAEGEKSKIGEYLGFGMEIYKARGGHGDECYILLSGNTQHSVTLGDSGSGAITRIHNTLEDVSIRNADRQETLDKIYHQVKIAQDAVKKPFEQEGELSMKIERLGEINVQLKNADAENAVTLPDEENIDTSVTDNTKKKLLERKVLMNVVACQNPIRTGNLRFSDAEPNCKYLGGIVSVGEYYALQETTDGGLIFHEKEQIGDILQGYAHGNDNILIVYDDKLGCSITEAQGGSDHEI